MSRTTVFAIDKQGLVGEIGVAHCAPAFFPIVWEWLGELYGARDPIRFPFFLAQGQMEKIWALHTDSRLTHHHRLLLVSTFDGAWFRHELAGRFVDAVGEFHQAWVRPRDIRPCAAECSVIVAEHAKKNPDTMGYCFHGTSVSENYWTQKIPLGRDGLPLTGNGEPYEFDYHPLNIKSVKRGAYGPDHYEVGDAHPSLKEPLDAPGWRMPVRT